nr:Crp/Fnr family transcriptional regulator [Hymenobacter piscis]
MTLPAQLARRFAHLEAPLREEMARVGQLRRVAAGEDVLRPGQLIRHHVLLVEGLLKIYRPGDDGQEFLVYYLSPGDACSLTLLPVPRAAEASLAVRAARPSQVLLLPTEAAEPWLTRYPAWTRFVVEAYRSRFDELLQTLDAVAFRALDERLVFYLRRHVQAQGPVLLLSHQQIADELSTAREVVSRLLKKLEQRGLLVLHRHGIEVRNLDALHP